MVAIHFTERVTDRLRKAASKGRDVTLADLPSPTYLSCLPLQPGARIRDAPCDAAGTRPGSGAAVSRARALLRRWRVPLTLAVTLVALQATGWTPALEYRRAAVLHGELWRLLTGSLVHLGWVHLARDLAGLFLIWGLFACSLNEHSALWILLVSMLSVGLCLLAFSPGILWYVGISGALFGLFCAGALCEFRENPFFAGTLLLGMAAVVAWTLYAGALPGETAGLGGRVVPQAHLYGAFGGAAFVLARAARRAVWV